jgi:cellulose synthase/poly-beta-1,6-N-acetylglucosamine synthase-like glycosyltransferase
MPVLNEENYVASAITAILTQKYAGNIRIVLALGPSTDKTNAVVANLQSKDSRISTVANPSGRTPDGLNAAISATTESVIVRVDAHSELSANYLTIAVETLWRTGADNVGGIMAAKGVTLFERAVATAMTSKLGVGAASFHVGGVEGPAETVYLGVFQRSALERVGGYDPSFTRAQDWEMNFRIRSTGGVVWFNPALQVTYRTRSSVRALVKQYFQYGQWRRKVMREHPETTRTKSALRYFAPPIAAIGILLGTLLGLAGIYFSEFPLLSWGFLAPVGYLALGLLASVTLVKKAGRAAWYLPVVLTLMQMSWGIGFLTSPKK